jgi:hypothetical protein
MFAGSLGPIVTKPGADNPMHSHNHVSGNAGNVEKCASRSMTVTVAKLVPGRKPWFSMAYYRPSVVFMRIKCL